MDSLLSSPVFWKLVVMAAVVFVWRFLVGFRGREFDFTGRPQQQTQADTAPGQEAPAASRRLPSAADPAAR
jgi:hypothetical protein